MKYLKIKALLTCSLLFFQFACTTPENIILDHSTSYQLEPDLEIVHVSQLESDYYKSLFSNKAENKLVLYKIVKGNNFKIYIGVGFETSKTTIIQAIRANQKALVLASDTTLFNQFTISQQLDSTAFSTHYFRELGSGNKYLFTAVSNTKKAISNQFITNYIESRIITKQ